MNVLFSMVIADLKRRAKDGFVLGYNVIFPVVMILLLGYLTSAGYGKDFTGYQYYSVVMLPFCIAMSMITAAYAGKDEAYKKTAIRFLFSPVSKAFIVLSKLFSCIIIISICNLLVLLFCMMAFHLPVSLSIVSIFVLLSAETLAVCTIGLFIGFGMKNFILIKNVLNIPIVLAAILGGAFYPIGTLNPSFEAVLRLSPLTWINRGMFLAIYDNNSTVLWITSTVLVIVGILFAILTVQLFKKEEFIHGDLPGYGQ